MLISAKKYTKRDFELLLIEARRLSNLTCKTEDEFSAWRRKTDRALIGVAGDDPDERYDAPERVEHRSFVERVFRRGRL